MLQIHNSVAVERTTREVFDFITDFDRRPEWRAAVNEVRRISEGPVGIGSKFILLGSFLGRTTEQTLEIVLHDPPTKLGYEVRGSGPLPLVKATYTLQAVGEGTRMDTTGTAQVAGPARLLTPLIRSLARKQMEADNARLKRVLEAQG